MLRKLLLVGLVAISGGAFAAPAPVFLRQAIMGNYSEVTLGRMIQNRGGTEQVRQFGAMLVRDHSNGLAQAQRIAARLKLSFIPILTPDARVESGRLRRLSGRAFDLEVRRFMIDAHRVVIRQFKAQARSGDRPTAGYAAATVAVLRRHLIAAEAIRG